MVGSERKRLQREKRKLKKKDKKIALKENRFRVYCASFINGFFNYRITHKLVNAFNSIEECRKFLEDKAGYFVDTQSDFIEYTNHSFETQSGYYQYRSGNCFKTRSKKFIPEKANLNWKKDGF